MFCVNSSDVWCDKASPSQTLKRSQISVPQEEKYAWPLITNPFCFLHPLNEQKPVYTSKGRDLSTDFS